MQQPCAVLGGCCGHGYVRANQTPKGTRPIPHTPRHRPHTSAYQHNWDQQYPRRGCAEAVVGEGWAGAGWLEARACSATPQHSVLE